MPSEPIWLPIAEVIELNRDAVAATGENFALLSLEKLEGALARPRQVYAYQSHHLPELASALLFAIARAHPFEQGNKRTAFSAAELFLNVNDYAIGVDSLDLADAIVAVLSGERTEASFCALLETLIAPVAR